MSDPTDRLSKQLEEILSELRRISPRPRTAGGAIWRLFGGLAQLLVFLAIVLWYLEGTGPLQNPYLLLAVTLQTMALTFFSLGK